VLEREVRANLVYRDFTRVGRAGRQDDGALEHGLGARSSPSPSQVMAVAASQDWHQRASITSKLLALDLGSDCKSTGRTASRLSIAQHQYSCHARPPDRLHISAPFKITYFRLK
jgi:hypothetical protein